MMKAATLILLTCVACASACPAGAFDTVSPDGLLHWVDWQGPDLLPPRFRNHCGFENFTGRPYCSDHCGADYQFYYCLEGSFGCCHLGHGYCDFDGLLRCRP